MVGGILKRWFEEEKGYKRREDLFCFDTNPGLGYDDDVNKADIVVMCVPTPPDDNGRCDLSILKEAISRLRSGMVIAIKSTVVPGTTVRLAHEFKDKKFLMSPEYLTERRAWEDFLGICGRQIVGHTGGDTIKYAKELLDLLPIAAFVRPWATDYSQSEIQATEAEMAKYFGNVFGAHKVIFANIFQDVCHAVRLVLESENIDVRIDYEKVRECVSADPRIGPAWLDVSHGKYRGYGGFCFPKDHLAFIMFMKDTRMLLATYLARYKSKDDKPYLLLARLTDGIRVMEAIWDANERLLLQQGITIKEVSRHDRELEEKLKKIADLD